MSVMISINVFYISGGFNGWSVLMTIGALNGGLFDVPSHSKKTATELCHTMVEPLS